MPASAFFILFYHFCTEKQVYTSYFLKITAYTGYAGWHVTAGIPVKFGTAHGRSRPEVGSTTRIDANGEKGVPPAPRNFGTFEQKMITPTVFLESKHNFYSLTVGRLLQYLPHSSAKSSLLP